MPRTYCIANLEFEDVTATEDSTVTSSTKKPFSDLELLKVNESLPEYGTSELNQFVLDGSHDVLPDNPSDVAFISAQKSDASGSFSAEQKLTVAFTENHTSAGITLYFAEDWADSVRIKWMSLRGTKLDEMTFSPNSLVYTCNHQVENYGNIEITFLHTHFPDTYVKLQYIAYGYNIEWEDDLVVDASVVEEVDVTSATLSINTASITILDENCDYDASNAEGLWHSIQKGQQVVIKEYENGFIRPMGTFYVDTWSWASNKATFRLHDVVGLLDRYKFYNGRVYNGISAEALISEICSVAKVKYTIADDMRDVPIYGYLGIMTCREAIQMCCFAIGAICDDSRSDSIRIFRQNRTVTSNIGTNRKFNGQSIVTLDTYVSGISIEYNTYELESEDSKIYEDVILAGDTRIEFNSPFDPSTITTTLGTIVEAKTNYLVIHADSEGDCVISGKKYAVNTNAYRKDTEGLDANQMENVVTFSKCTLYNASLFEGIAKELLRYYEMRQKVHMRYILEHEAVGDWAEIADPNKHFSVTLIEKQSIDLAKGFIASAECRGYSSVNNFVYYTRELKAGEQIGVWIP